MVIQARIHRNGRITVGRLGRHVSNTLHPTLHPHSTPSSSIYDYHQKFT